MKPHVCVLILAGGSGTRLWPLGRRSRPKTLLPLAGGQSPLRRTVSLARSVARSEHIWVVADATLWRRVRRHLGEREVPRLIAEPAPRNTAAALALGVQFAVKRTGAKWGLCLPADQWIRRPSAFVRLVRRIVSEAANDGLVTFGVPAAYPNPSYGYIALGERLSGTLWAARRFVEKPSVERARRYVRSRRWLWNSGMFLWKLETFLREVQRYLPSVASAAYGLTSSDVRLRRAALREWLGLESISVDHGVLQRSKTVRVARCDAGWVDLGSWDALAHVFPRAADSTAHLGTYRSIGGADCLVHAPEHLTVNLGARGVGVVVTDDAVLLFDRSQHERVREVVALLRRERALERFL